MLDPPERGIRGNSHMIMQDKNNLKIADLILQWIDERLLVVAPFAWSDGTCEFCRQGLQTSCLHGGFWGGELDGGQGEAVRVPQADGTLVKLPVGPDDALMPALLTLSDVLGTGHHAAKAAKVGSGKIVAVVGDGAVGSSSRARAEPWAASECRRRRRCPRPFRCSSTT